ncbi:hypothetical protein QOT17_018903 [Balamuthia mandrillaris]
MERQRDSNDGTADRLVELKIHPEVLQRRCPCCWDTLLTGLKGSVVFAVVGTIGSLRRWPPITPAPLHFLFALSVRGSKHKASSAAAAAGGSRWYEILYLPLGIALLGFGLGSYIGYRECDLTLQMRSQWQKAQQQHKHSSSSSSAELPR